MRWPIRLQLVLPLLLLLLAAMGISTWTGVGSARRARRQTEERMRQVAGFLNEDRSYPLTEQILRQVKRLSGADYVLLPRPGDERRQPLTTLETIPSDLPAPVHNDWRELPLGEPVHLGETTYFTSSIRLRSRTNRGDILYILYPKRLWEATLWEAVWPSAVLGGSLGLGAFALALGLGQRLTRRIQKLEQQTRMIAIGQFSPLPLPPGNDEILDLARSINDMAQQLAHLQQSVQRNERLRLLGQVSAGIAHQIRNGLTGARLAVQLYLQESGETADATPLQVALRQLTLLESNLKRFLALGRDEPPRPGKAEPAGEAMDLADLVNDTVALLRPQSKHAGIQLRWQPPEAGIWVRGRAADLGQMILNVLSNALEAAGPGGEVEVQLLREVNRGKPPRVWIDILDSGPGPPQAIAGTLFELFVTGKSEGVGLGLAVARQTAEEHGGSLGWDRVNERTRFRIQLPCQPGPEATTREVRAASLERLS
jgi:signal transduction histidine kinase